MGGIALLDKPSPTTEQIDILNAVDLTSDNIMIEAYAGCGKTSTLEMLASHLPRTAPILYLVFGKKNAEEAVLRMPSYVIPKTFNSIGHSIWSTTISRNLRLNAKKTGDIYRALIDEAPRNQQSLLWASFSEVTQAVALAKAVGYLPADTYPGIKPLIGQGQFHSLLDEEPDDLTSDLINEVLVRGIKQAFDGLVDYNDQIYMPALFRGTFPKYGTILVDEYQDLSPTNHAMLTKLASKARLIGVGDQHQNIYGFRGAKAGGMTQAISTYSMTTLPLSTSFRCPSEIVRHVHWHVPKFRASRKGGSVRVPSRLHHADIMDGSTIVCRNNAPLLRSALELLGAGRSINLAGSDIGPRLIGIMKKLGPSDLRQSAVFTAIAEWETTKLSRESKSAPDLANCMRVFAEHGTTLDLAIRYAEHLFAQTGTILLSTIHKAKGLEWSNVIHLDPWLVRKQPTDQNKNLDYVASTRSSDSLTEIDSGDIEW
jgi:DNA helicase II / ATP-dependent DNA helicase PcrA